MLMNTKGRWAAVACMLTVLLTTSIYAQNNELSAKAVAADKALLELVPAKAWGFVVIRNIESISEKTGAWAEKLGIEDPQIKMQLQTATGFTQGLDLVGSAAIVVLDQDAYPGGMVVIAPIDDYDAMVEHLSPEKQPSGLTKLQLPREEPAYALRKGKYLILAPTEAPFREFTGTMVTASSQLDEARLQAMGTSDVFAHVNLPTLAQRASGMLQMFGMMAMGGMGGGGGMGPQSDMIMQQIQFLVDVLNQLQALDLAISFDQDGLDLTAMLSFQNGSEMARLMNLQTPTAAPLLTGLQTDQPYMLVMGGQWNNDEQFAAKMAAMAPMASQEDTQKLRELAMEKARLEKGMALSVNGASKGNPGVFELAGVIVTEDAKAYLANAQSSVELMKNMQIAIPQQNGAGGQGQQQATPMDMSNMYSYQAKAEVIEGLDVDHMIFDLSSMMSNMGAMMPPEANAMLAMILGPEGLRIKVRLAAVDDTHVVMGYGMTADRFAEHIKAARSKTQLATTYGSVDKVASRMPKKRNGVMYLSAEGIVKTVQAAQQRMDMPLDHPELAQTKGLDMPLGISYAGMENTLRMDVHVPGELVLAGKELYETLAPAMMGAAMGPQPMLMDDDTTDSDSGQDVPDEDF